MRQILSESDLIINPDGSIYHLRLKPGEIGRKIITVGDPDRVPQVAACFDEIVLQRNSREFHTVTGLLNGEMVTVISTGIGTDNIDIVITELDALVNIDFDKRLPKEHLSELTFIRLGTSGAIHNHIAMDTILISEYALGFDALGLFYPHHNLINDISINGKTPYSTQCDPELLTHFADHFVKGVTLTMPGFYNPQGRLSRIENNITNSVKHLFNHNSSLGKITNIEMETAGIYLLSKYFGHRAISVNAILANRVFGTYSKSPEKTVKHMITQVMEVVKDL